MLISYVAESQYNDLFWLSVGPYSNNLLNYNNVGRVDFCESNSSVEKIYFGANSGGFWIYDKSKDTVFCTSENIPGGVSRIVINPNDSLNVFAVFGFYANGVKKNMGYSYGLFSSNDGGYTWQKKSLPILAEMLIEIKDIVFDVFNPQKIYALATDRIYYSSDTGNSWQLMKFKPKTNEEFLQIFSMDNGSLVVSGKNCLYFSNERQNKWENKLPDFLQQNSLVKISRSENKLWVAVYNENEKEDFILITSNLGESFEIKRQNLSFKKYVTFIKAFNDSIVFCGGLYLKYSKDGGNTFLNVKGSTHLDVRDVFFPEKNDYSKLYLANDGGLFYTENLGVKWTLISTESLYDCYTVSVSDEDSCVILTGAHDNGSFLMNRQGKWSHILGGDGSAVYTDKKGENMLAYVNKDLKSGTNGKTWKSTKVKNSLFGVKPLHHLTYDSLYYSSTFSKSKNMFAVVKSTDFGKTFQSSDNALGYCWGIITAMEISSGNDEILYFSGFDLWDGKYFNLQQVKVKNGKVTQYELLDERTNKRLFISDIHLDKKNEQLWITFGGFEKNKKIWKSENEGSSWIDLTFDLPNVPVYAVYYNDNLDLLLIGNDYGVFYLENNKWKKFGKNLPAIAVTDFDINDVTNELYISTYARGIWKIQLPVK